MSLSQTPLLSLGKHTTTSPIKHSTPYSDFITFFRTTVMSSSAKKPKRSTSPTQSSIKSSGYLVTCDAPTKQFILHLNEAKPVEKKFVLQDLDATHLLIKSKSREEILTQVERWMDENVFSSVEKVGEDLDMS